MTNSPQTTTASSWLGRRGRWGLLLLLLLASLLYGATLDTGLTPGDLQGGDLITHQYAQVQARPSNAPGYPLYTMGGWAWFHGWRLLFPHANPVPILSSYSTLWALLALALFFVLLYRITSGHLFISLGFSLFYAMTYFFWYYAVSTEQYTSAVLHTLLIVAVLLAWDERQQERWLYALALLLGLGLAHMVTVLFIGPGALAFVLLKQPQLLKRGRLILKGTLLALLPLTSYSYVYVRGAQHPEWWGAGQWASASQWFLSFIATKQGQDELTWSLLPMKLGQFSLIWMELTPLLLLVGLAGWYVWRGRPAILFTTTALIYLIFCYIDRQGNWFQVIMPLYPLILLGAAYAWLQLWQRNHGHFWRGLLLALLAALIIGKGTDVYPRANQRHRADDTGLVPGQHILAQNPPQNSAIITDMQEKLALDYLTTIWGLRPDVSALGPSDAFRALEAQRPLLVSATAANYAAAQSGLPLRYTAWGPSLLLASPQQLPQRSIRDLTYSGAKLGDNLILLGYQVQKSDTLTTLHLALKARQTPQQNWAISVRLLAGGNIIMQQDHAAPALGFTPTTSLRPGQTVFDAFTLSWPDTAPPPDTLQIILYRQLADGSFQNLTNQTFPLSID